jgi:hypothetical protein
MSRQPIYKIGDTVYAAYTDIRPSWQGSLVIEKPLKVMGMALGNNGKIVYYFEDPDLVEIEESTLFATEAELLQHISGWLQATPVKSETKGGKDASTK